MNIKQIYNLAIELGKLADPRSANRLKKILEIEKERFSAMTKPEKEFFDTEILTNPYADSRYFAKNGNIEIKNILAGIDIDGSEVLLADKLNQQGKKIDLILSHHPIGNALASLDSVMYLQADLLASVGIPINIAESLLEKRISEVSRSISAINHYQVVDMAELVNLPIMCIHTPADNLAYQFLKTHLDLAKPETVADVIKSLKKIPEYQIASLRGAGPKIFAGSGHRRTGRIALTEMTGGTSGAKEIYEHLAKAGIGTIVGMHMKEEHCAEAEKNHINVVIAGHMASDSLGLNLFLDKLVEKNINIIACSGLIRVKRNRK